MAKVNLDEMNYRQRLEYFASGSVTTGKITQLLDDCLEDFHVGKVRGRIVSGENNEYKFGTKEEAHAAALSFRKHAQDELHAGIEAMALDAMPH